MVFKAESIDATTLTIEPFSCEKSQMWARTMCVCNWLLFYSYVLDLPFASPSDISLNMSTINIE